MNERIKDAWEKAAQDHSGDSWAEQTAFLEKFAELIVQKCLDQCYNRGMNDELYAGQLKAAAYIEEYFGVEE